MSGGTTPPAAPLISSSPANQATAAASGLGGSGAVILIIWLFSLAHITIPTDAAVELAALAAAGVHWAMLKYGIQTP
jgi:hypothetical protein